MKRFITTSGKLYRRLPAQVNKYVEHDIKPIDEYAPGWSPANATSSEQVVKAIKAREETVEELQKDTVDWLEEKNERNKKNGKK